MKDVDSFLHGLETAGKSYSKSIRPAEVEVSPEATATPAVLITLSFKKGMALTKVQKEEIVARVRDGIKAAKSVVFVNFHGLGVSDTNLMRKELQAQGTVYTVAKKTLLRLALTESGVAGEMPELPGEVAVAYGDDPVAPAGAIARFAKKYDKRLAILGGVFEGAFADRERMEMIAAIPGMQVLRGMFVNVINSPIQGFAVALSEIAKTKSQP